MGRLQARLNGLSDNEYNEAVDAANERATRKADREAKKKAQLPTLEQQRLIPSPSVTIDIWVIFGKMCSNRSLLNKNNSISYE
jgi:hypothetical protein